MLCSSITKVSQGLELAKREENPLPLYSHGLWSCDILSVVSEILYQCEQHLYFCGISTSEGQGETGPRVNHSSAFCAEMQQVHINQTNGFFSSFDSFQLHLGGCLFGLCVFTWIFFFVSIPTC